MDRELDRSRISTQVNSTAAAVAACLFGLATPAGATSFQVTSLTTDDNGNLQALGFPAAPNVDPNLVNPWGISFGPTTPFWVSDNGKGVSTLYNAAGVPFPLPPMAPLVVTIATPSGQPAGTAAPTGQVFNSNTTAFVVSNGTASGSANFIFATEDGTISGRSGAVDSTQSFIPPTVDNSGSGAVYKGLAIGTTTNGTFLYAANFNSGNVEMYNTSWGLVKSFTDTTLPPGYAPFNVQVLNGKLYVTFALQDSDKHDDVAGMGHGFVDVFDLDGTGMQRLVSNGDLNSPWGLAIAPANFGEYSNDLLVGNFGDGEIHAFTLTGTPIGTLDGINGNAIDIPGLWAITPGNSTADPNANTVFFTAGLPKADAPDDLEKAGLFGDLTLAAPAVPEPGSLALLATGLTGLMWLRRRRRPPSIQI